MAGRTEIAQAYLEHDNIRSLLDALLVELDEPKPTAFLSDLRRRLQEVVFGHLQREDWFVFPSLLADCYDDKSEAARRVIAEHGDFQCAVSAHISQWPDERVAEDWAGYGAACRRIAGMLRQRMKDEERLIYAPIVKELMELHCQPENKDMKSRLADRLTAMAGQRRLLFTLRR